MRGKVVQLPTRAAAEPYALFHALPSAVLVLDKQLNIVFVNHTAEQLFGMSEAALLHSSIHQLFDTDCDVIGLLRNAADHGMVVKAYDHVIRGPRLAEHTVALQIAPLQPEGVRTQHTLLIIDDRTMTEKIETQHSQREITRAAGVMAAMIAHEVKNPLSGIRGAAQLLEENATRDEQKLTQLIQNEVQRINRVLNQVELFSGETAYQTAPVNVHELLVYTRDVAEKGFAQHVTFREEFDPSLPNISGNRDMLIHLLMNLVKNAAEALTDRKDGVITLTTSYRSGYKFRKPGEQQYRTLPISIVIRDNGPGIPPQIRPTLFDPFVTARQGGKGLGLAIVAKIVADHGGVIELEEQEHHTVFRIMLPQFNAVQPTNPAVKPHP